jgi:hypothetical protein
MARMLFTDCILRSRFCSLGVVNTHKDINNGIGSLFYCSVCTCTTGMAGEQIQVAQLLTGFQKGRNIEAS